METNDKVREITWIKSALQGLAFWVGYKKELYPHYHLTEGAIVGELTSLIHSKLDKDEKLMCERMYSTILDKLDESSNDMRRLDLAIVYKNEDSLKYAIEVKRGDSSNKLIDEDFNRLYEIKQSNPEVGCYLILVCESKKHKRFINENGTAITHLHTKEPENSYKLNVRRVCKATSTFKIRTTTAHYVCLIEVSLKENEG